MAAELPNCSRERLESMQVRYLGREERRLYEVVVGEQGKLVWRKDGVRVDTTEAWRDSIRGIVEVGSDEPEWAHDRPGWARGSSESSAGPSDLDEDGGSMAGVGTAATAKEKDNPEQAATNRTMQEQPASPTQEQQSNKSFSLHDLIRIPTRENRNGDAAAKGEKESRKKGKKQMWIFLADTKNNLYIGIKQSGAFQHSSFLHGSRVSAAGIISVRDGQLRSKSRHLEVFPFRRC